MFERSEAGQQNRAIFLRVDFVCYVEGGGGDSDTSDDCYFWSKVFSALRPDLTIRFLACGGKPALEKIANDLAKKDMQNILVAMDADHDHFDEQTIKHPKVLYSYGYSWENDAFNSEALPGILANTLMLTGPLELGARNTLDEQHSLLMRALKWPTRADYLTFCNKGSLFLRDKPGRIIEVDNLSGLPVIKIKEVICLCAKYNNNSRPRRLAPRSHFSDIGRYCVGHIYAHAMIALIRSVAKQKKRSNNLSSAHIRNVSVLSFESFLKQKDLSPVRNHYRSACEAV